MPERRTQSINFNALDSMVLSYMLCEGLTEESGTFDSSREVKRKCLTVRDCINEGEIDKAGDLIREDNRLQFLLKKQVLVEMLRKKTSDGDADALRWIRQELAPTATEAYPDAYDEFKKLLLMFVFEEQTSGSPVSYEWSNESRRYLGDVVYGFKDPDLVNLLKYLLLHVGTSKKGAKEGEVQDTSWTEKIYIGNRMPSPMSMGEESKMEISEKDIDAIAQALDISQVDAAKALHRSKGDVSAAFETEIGRLRLNMEELNNLVLEYAGYRGLLQLSESESEESDGKEEFQDSNSDTDMLDVAETSDISISNCFTDADRPKYPVRKLKRLSYKHDPNLKVILRVLKKVKDGKYLETIEQVKEIDVELYKRYPQVLFELWRFEVLRVAEGGSYDIALDLLRKNLTPIVEHNSDLFPRLKETMAMLLSPKTEYPSTSRLCTGLQAALQESMNLPGPQLIHYVKHLLDDYQLWLDSRNSQDIFSKNLGIDVLLHGMSEISLGPAHLNLNDDHEAERAPGDSERSASMGWRSVTSEESVVELSEMVINQVMDVLNFPRSHVIDLLLQHEGNAELAVLHVVQQGEEQ